MAKNFYELLDAIGGVYGVNEEYADEAGGKAFGMAHVASELGITYGVIITAHPPDHSREAYLVAMHELGHLYQQRTKDGWKTEPDSLTDADHEAYAWRWALDRSIITPTAEELADIIERLESYRSKAWEALLQELEALAVVAP